MCDHPTAELLLPLAQGKLSAEEEVLAREHLVSCPLCRKRLEVLRWIKETAMERGSALFSDHPAPEKLVAFCESSPAASSDENASIRAHLELCQSCAAEVETLRKINASLAADTGHAADEAQTPQSFSGLSGILHRFRWFVMTGSPVPAYIVVLILIVPAYLGVRQLLAPGEPTGIVVDSTSIRAVDSPFRLSADGERGDQERPVFQVTKGSEFALLFEVPIAEDSNLRYDAELLGPERRRVWEQPGLESIDRFGTFLIVIGAPGLPSGAHTLLLHERDLRAGQIRHTFRFSFGLEIRP
jgi:anti-sigma factor ChrR (cupin superfamily)